MEKQYIRNLKSILLTMAILFILLYFLFFSNRQLWFSFDKNSQLTITLKCGNQKEILYPYYNESEGIYYFFLPSFVQNNAIFSNYSFSFPIYINEKPLTILEQFCWEDDSIYNISTNSKSYAVKFMRSSNIPSIYIQTESGSTEYIDEDKTHCESGFIRVLSNTGHIEYDGTLEEIHARGNYTMLAGKKSYAISLGESKKLCNMEASKRWNLLALFYEHDKIRSRIVFDMAHFLNMDFVPDCSWVDVYCNGEYKGLYLLIEHVAVGKGRVDIYDLETDNELANPDIVLDSLTPHREGTDSYFEINNGPNISGGYLLEKTFDSRLKEDAGYFALTTVPYAYFSVNAPKHPSKEQLQYIKTFVNGIETMLQSNNPHYKDYIDLDGFAKHFLLEKIVMDPDAMKYSTFYYKEQNSDVLRVGPIWDYDMALGGLEYNYESPMDDSHGFMNEWYLKLYADEEFYNIMISYYKEMLPYLAFILDTQIDEYVSFLSSSIAMDEIIMGQYNREEFTRSYLNHENYVRYLKFFLAQRLNYLNKLWGISYSSFDLPVSTGELHTVTFFLSDGTKLESRQVLDGSLCSPPILDSEQYSGWQFRHSGKVFNHMIPIYEDTVLYPLE